MSVVEVTERKHIVSHRTLFARKSMLHNFNNVVQLPISDIGFRPFHERRFNMELSIRPQIEMRVTGSYRGMVAGFHGVSVGCEFQLVFQPKDP